MDDCFCQEDRMAVSKTCFQLCIYRWTINHQKYFSPFVTLLSRQDLPLLYNEFLLKSLFKNQVVVPPPAVKPMEAFSTFIMKNLIFYFFNDGKNLSDEIVHSEACVLLLQPHKRPGMLQENATENQNNWDRKGPLKVIWTSLLLKVANLKARASSEVRSDCSGHIQLGFEYLQGWSLCSLSGQSIHPSGEETKPKYRVTAVLANCVCC